MENLYKQIEAYLDGTLPSDERLAFEGRMAEDEEFRNEVDLHRALKEEFSSRRGWDLFATIGEIIKEESASPVENPLEKAPTRPFTWWWFIPVLILIGVGIWYFNTIENPTGGSPPPPNHEDTLPIPPIDRVKKKPVDPPKAPKQMAEAVPGGFAKNDRLERRRMNLWRGVNQEARLTVTYPKDSSTTILLDEKGNSILKFRGIVADIGQNENSKNFYQLVIFNNVGQIKMRRPFTLTAIGSGTATFNLSYEVDFPLGLYYFQIEETKSGNLKAFERFFIGKK